MVATLHRQRVARVLALERQRTRIAMDLHDKIGAGLGSLTLLADMACEQAVDAAPVRELVGEIGDAAAELSPALDDIVGGLRPGADSLESLARSLAERGRLLFPGDDAVVEPRFPSSWPTTRLGLIVRQDVFLIGLEALHNAARHAAPEHVVLEFSPEERGWRMTVRDDGRGIEAKGRSRHGGGRGWKAWSAARARSAPDSRSSVGRERRRGFA